VLLRRGLTVVLAGPPNAGKSSLLNRLAGRDRAIVSHVPGTTRDVIEQHVDIDGMPLTVVDTAGLRASADEIEGEGVRRALSAAAEADLVILVIDDAERPDETLSEALATLPAGLPILEVRNKIDLSGRAPGHCGDGETPVVALSARTGAGVDYLRGALRRQAGLDAGAEPEFLARRRHLDALRRALDALAAAAGQVEGGHGELAAEELRGAQRALGEITGEFTSEDLLDRIFSRFCIGK
jgi:tRNA modification GTPase